LKQHGQQKRIDDLSVVIQAGGESRRMGRPKATVPFLGRPLIQQSINNLLPIAGELIVTTNDIEGTKAALPEKEFAQIRFEKDIRNERSSLNGLLTALSTAHKPYVALSACDMIFASADLFVFEYNLMKQGDFDLVIPADSNGFEPFHAIYRKETCLPLVEAALDAGERKMSSWFPDSKLHEVSRNDILSICPQGGTFINLNTPDELKRIEDRITQGAFVQQQERQDS
jgi:molybdopterin-guanine dinucleotide biosynthesis protein